MPRYGGAPSWSCCSHPAARPAAAHDRLPHWKPVPTGYRGLDAVAFPLAAHAHAQEVADMCAYDPPIVFAGAVEPGAYETLRAVAAESR